MKKLLSIIALFSLLSCTKEYSREAQCGIITGKKIREHAFIFEVKMGQDTTEINVGAIWYDQYNNGDTFCK